MKIGKPVTPARRISKIGLSFIMASTCLGAGESEAELAICLDRGADPAVIAHAQAIAAEMLSRVGIATKWYSYRGSCLRRPDNPIAIRIVSHVPENHHPDALAAARPFDGIRIEVFYERVKGAVDSGLVPRLLAHVLVHEITHIIQGTDSHSDFGIMKAHWNTDDYHQMMHAPLGFTEEDLQLIRNGLRSRMEHKLE